LGWFDSQYTAKTGGHWPYSEQQSDINVVELKAAFLTLQSFFGASKDKHIAIQLDSMVAVSYINKMGGRKKELNNLCKNMWGWCISRYIWISATHVPGVQNVQADRLSRKLNDDLEWMLSKDIFSFVYQKYSLKGATDLFASRINNQLPKYVACLPDPMAIPVGAFYTPVENGTYYGMVMSVRFSARPSVSHTLDNDSFRSFSQ
jgi:hypothetical protein